MTRQGAILILAGTMTLSLALPATAGAVPGDLTYRDCITGDNLVGPAPDGTGACAKIATATDGGAGSGISRPESVATSADETSVYLATGFEDNGVAHFRRDPATGALTYIGCITGDSDVTACEQIPAATSGADESGLEYPEGVTVSPDSRSVYLTSRFDDAISHFSRDPVTGELTYVGCISGDSDLVSIGPDPCEIIPGATAGGQNSGFDDLKTKSVLVSADGESLYAASEDDSAILRFDRDPATGALAFDECITGELATTNCDAIPTATADGEESGLNAPRWLAADPSQTSVYVAADQDHGVAHFDRDPVSGELEYVDCITGESESSASCATIPSASTNASFSGLQNPRAVEVSVDGEFLYVGTSGNSVALARFDRDPATGEVTYLDCVTGSIETGPEPDGSGACTTIPSATMADPPEIQSGEASGLLGIRSMALSGDGLSLYVGAQFDSAIARFNLDQASGVASYVGCVTGDGAVGPEPEGSGACAAIPSVTPAGDFGFGSGLGAPSMIALTADDRSLYAAAQSDSAVARFDRELLPVPALAPDTANCQGDRVTKTNGTSGDDEIVGTGDKDAIFGLGGDDGIRGVGGPDCLDGDSGADALKGGGGRDRVKGEGGRDRLRGQTGRDRLNGGGGRDDLNGGASSDSLRGGAGKDKLRGGPSRDKLRGNGGGDTIVSGGGKDKVNCGGGNDKVVAGPKDKVADNCEVVR